MKKLLLIIVTFASQYAFGMPDDAREALKSVTGSDQNLARGLMKVIESDSMEEVRVEMSKLVQQDKTHLVSIALRDPSDHIKLEAVKALVSVKKKSIALAVLDASKDLEIAVRGGTEADALRERTKQAFENTLVSMTGLRVEKEWDMERKILEFGKKIENLPE